MWMNKIRDMGRNLCGLDAWQEGPVSLPAGLSCPAPENPFQRSANRIVGGQDDDRASTWPWIVDLEGEAYCGGSIISKNPSGQSDWILTCNFRIIEFFFYIIDNISIFNIFKIIYVNFSCVLLRMELFDWRLNRFAKSTVQFTWWILCDLNSRDQPPRFHRREQPRRRLGHRTRHLSARGSESDRLAVSRLRQLLVASLLAFRTHRARPILLCCRLGRYKFWRRSFFRGAFKIVPEF